MKNYIYYLPNGRIVKSSNHPPNNILENSLLTIEIDKNLPVFEMYVDNGVLKNLPPKPSPDHTFNYESFVWEDVRSDKERIFSIKILRNQLLEKSDWTDTVSAEKRLGTSLYLKWQEYRQQLRDITSQSGYPFNVVWPTQPE